MINSKNIKFLGYTLVCLIVLSISWPGMATSLFNAGSASLYSDVKARQIGDLVTVIIQEQATASQTANTSSGKGTSVGIGPYGGSLADLIPFLKTTTNKPLVTASTSDDFNASGSTSRGGSISAKLTTQVVEIYNNGTLKIEGTQKITINGEEQEIVVSGIVRTRDISPDNTVLSSLVANAEIQYVGIGVVGDKQKPGLLTRLLNWLF
ncbi:MAG: flagellar basal body L-ring protein FlgH [Firmicutes bacterium]|nr:flagellar basal body L-ring protein FlgH [Bacillota bacterium]